jgi:hypothetical protein
MVQEYFVNVAEKPDLWTFIPGPVNVDAAVCEAGKDFALPFDTLRPKTQWLMRTTNPVYFSTSSAGRAGPVESTRDGNR